jgi:tetratricopeptide (TPR) repeat protein
MADVFLSYARADDAVADRVARTLSKAGISVWFDRELPAHRPYSDVIATELESAAAVLVLWSKASVESQWVRSEANRARELGKLVQARIDDTRLPMPFDQIQCADLRGWRGGRAHDGWTQVRKSIAALVGGGIVAVHLAEKPVASRRGVIIGGAAAAVAMAAAGVALFRREEDHPSPEAALLIEKGIDALQNNDVFAADDAGSLSNAIALLTDATRADPQSATAWGSLALAYAALKRVSPFAARAGLASRSRSAAATTFRLKAHEPRATAALLLLYPLYRHWRSAEQADRAALKGSPPIPLLQFLLSETLGSVGRWKDAAAVSAQADRTHFIIPGADRRVVVDLWSAGDLQGADEALKLAIEHWPQQPQVWRTRLHYLMFSGRSSEALAVLHNEAERPPGTPEGFMRALDATGRALAGEGDAADAIRRNVAYLKSEPPAVFGVTHACAALGDLSTSFAILQGYYFGEGPWNKVAPAAGDEDRATSSLFQPPMHNAWRDSRFGALLQRIGLNDYWRASRTVPDFRRSS